MRFITIQIPIFDTGETPEAKVEKMKEELDELLDEFCHGPVNKKTALSEMFDVVQVMHGFIQAEVKNLLVGDDIQTYVERCFKKGNDAHIEKMTIRSAERGWEVP